MRRKNPSVVCNRQGPDGDWRGGARPHQIIPATQGTETSSIRATHPPEGRPAPFQGKTLPCTALTVVAYGQRLVSSLDAVQAENEAPTTEQLALLNRVAERVLQELRVDGRTPVRTRPPAA